MAFCDTQKLADWKALDSQYVRVFAAKQHARGLSPRGIQRQLSAVRTFLSYLIRERVLKSNPRWKCALPRAKHLPHTLDADQMSKLLDFRTADGLAVRDKAMMELLYSSGLRLQELISLDLTAVDLADRTLRVTGKGNKARILPIGRFAVDAIKAWIKERAAIAAVDEAALFVRPQRATHRRSCRAAADRPLGATVRPRRKDPSASFPSFLRHAPARIEREPARRAGTSRPRQYQYDAGVYAS